MSEPGNGKRLNGTKEKAGRFHGPRPSHSRRPKSYKVVCAGCGKEVAVQVPPPNDKKLFCIECFKK